MSQWVTATNSTISLILLCNYRATYMHAVVWFLKVSTNQIHKSFVVARIMIYLFIHKPSSRSTWFQYAKHQLNILYWVLAVLCVSCFIKCSNCCWIHHKVKTLLNILRCWRVLKSLSELKRDNMGTQNLFFTTAVSHSSDLIFFLRFCRLLFLHR